MDVIRIDGIRARGRHGVLPEERRDGQEFVVDVELRVDQRRAARTDDLAHTVNYAAVAAAVVAEIEGGPVDLIETLAQRIADRCLAERGVLGIEVAVHKPGAPMPAAHGRPSVRIRRAGAAAPFALALGSNLGDRLGHLRGALAALDARTDLVVTGVSGVYETDPVGRTDQPAFLNAVVTGWTALAPAELLATAQGLEDAAGRVRTERWGPRTLDVDVLAVGLARLATADLTLPHPRAHQRAFVLVPWLDADPQAELPGHGPVRALVGAVDRGGVRATDLELDA